MQELRWNPSVLMVLYRSQSKSLNVHIYSKKELWINWEKDIIWCSLNTENLRNVSPNILMWAFNTEIKWSINKIKNIAYSFKIRKFIDYNEVFIKIISFSV